MKIKLKNRKLTVNMENDFMFVGEGEPHVDIIDNDNSIENFKLKNYLTDNNKPVDIVVDGNDFTVKSMIIGRKSDNNMWDDIIIECFDIELSLLNILMIKGLNHEPVEIAFSGGDIVYSVLMMGAGGDKNTITIKPIDIMIDNVDW